MPPSAASQSQSTWTAASTRTPKNRTVTSDGTPLSKRSVSSYSDYSSASGYYTSDEPPTQRPFFSLDDENTFPNGGVVGWLRKRVDEFSHAIAPPDDGHKRGWLYTPRDDVSLALAASSARPRPTRAGKIAAIPWRELVGLKESLLTHMEGAAVAEEQLDERAAFGGEQADAIRRRAAELEGAAAELQKVIAADDAETSAIGASLRRQLEGIAEERMRTAEEHRRLEERLDARRAQAIAQGGSTLMGQVAQKHAAQLQQARERTRVARARAAVQSAALGAEIRQLETQLRASASAAGGGAHVQGDDEALVEARLSTSLRNIERGFTHRRAPPPARAPTLVARWRRLQQGEPFEQLSGASSQSVWVALSSDVRTVEVSASKGVAPHTKLPLAEVIHLAHGRGPAAARAAGGSWNRGARTLTLVSVRGDQATLRLASGDASELCFWWYGLQELSSIPSAERLSRGAILWRIAAALYRARSSAV